MATCAESSITMRPFLESLTKLDDGSNVFSQKCINFKGFATLNLLDIVPHDSEGKLELPSQPSKHQLTSLLEAVRRNTESFATLAENANVALNPASITPLLTVVCLLGNNFLFYFRRIKPDHCTCSFSTFITCIKSGLFSTDCEAWETQRPSMKPCLNV